ncbi:hypothetical protein DPEC_G00079960 [Dallia pectoralis]|uniref:Uncharacterized protein n=1 Tax=Dallia pectoralis TaxID=75939 RepID=A0ACC2H5A8_DALPE|nr:hypothetical protein DPEC_G00079960 [Dallia pectoralis]
MPGPEQRPREHLSGSNCLRMASDLCGPGVQTCGTPRSPGTQLPRQLDPVRRSTMQHSAPGQACGHRAQAGKLPMGGSGQRWGRGGRSGVMAEAHHNQVPTGAVSGENYRGQRRTNTN